VATHRLDLIIESRYARNYSPKFQAEFHVSEEEPDGPFEGFLDHLSNMWTTSIQSCLPSGSAP